MLWDMIPTRLSEFLVLATLVAVAGCAHHQTWTSRFGRDHPLVGRVWDVNAQRFVEPDALIATASGSRFVMLGEKHDNADGHRLQAEVVRRLLAAGRRPAVGFEMFTLDQAPTIEAYLKTHPRDGAGLGDALNWKKSGWPDWTLYQPIVQAALDAGVPVLATNLRASTIQVLRKDGLKGLDAPFSERYGLDRPLPAAVEDELAEEIRASHCHQAPESIVPMMTAVQRARDATMADALVTGATSDGAVLITGAGHARTDRGVPVYLRARDPRARITAIAFEEVQDGVDDPAVYERSKAIGRAPFDYLWFTPRVDNEDPCEQFKKSLEHLHERK